LDKKAAKYLKKMGHAYEPPEGMQDIGLLAKKQMTRLEGTLCKTVGIIPLDKDPNERNVEDVADNRG